MTNLLNLARLLVLVLRLPGRALSWWFDQVRHPGSRPLDPWMRGVVSVATWLFAAVLVGQLFVAPASTPAVPSEAYAAVKAPTGRDRMIPSDRMKVGRVIDGDTIEMADGRKVRVLGIDSCEMSSPGGAAAKYEAERLLADQYVTLQPQAGAPDVDRYGRLLRYVSLEQGDFGLLMVGYAHTSVYEGRNDASADYIRELRAHDRDHAPTSRDCGAYPPVQGPVPDVNNTHGDPRGHAPRTHD
jgi:endonuclease YncB( thermonuclease family)